MEISPKQSWPELIKPTPRQREFINAAFAHDFTLYGGAAGGGKSYILRWFLVMYLHSLYANHRIKNAQVALFTEDYPTLWDRQISRMQAEFPAWLGNFYLSETKHFRLNRQWGGGYLMLRNLDDPSKYQSAEFAAIGVDELTKNEKGVFDYLRFRLRWPGIEHPKFIAGTNPGGIGHAWVKKLWIEKNFPPEMQSLASQFAFVQAKASDNPHLTEAYYNSLKTLPPDMARAFAEGDWNLFAGQYFAIWNEAAHVIRPIDLKPWWTRWISMDWGFAHPSSIHWHTQDGDSTITYREFHHDRMSEHDIGQAIIDLSKGERIDAFYLSPDAFAKRTSNDTVAQQIGEVVSRGGIPAPSPADNDRIGGWRLMYQLLKSGLWKVTTDCPQLIRCMPTLIRDENHLEDVLKVDASENEIGDDAADSVRYGLKTRLSPRGTPFEVVLKEKTAEVPDMTSRAIYTQKLIAEHTKQTKQAMWQGASRMRYARHGH